MGLYLSAKAEIRNEYWTLTFLADLSRITDRHLERQQQIEIRDAFTNLGVYCIDSVNNAHGKSSVPRISIYEERNLYKIGDIFYTRFWSLLNSEVVEKCENGFPYPWTNLGTTFADFRGVALGILVADAPRIGDDDAGNYIFQFSKPTATDQHRRATIHGASKAIVYSNKLALRITNSLWPAIKQFFGDSEPGVAAREEGGKREITVTRFQKGRSLYISSLGRLNQNTRSLKRYPVKYLIVVSYENRWQLGRLVERIHNMGVLRLAAIFDIELLQEASNNLRNLYERWRKRSRGDVNGRDEADKEVSDINRFAEELDGLGSNIKFGLTYRIERAAYYFESFESTARDMRTRLVDGFQPYPDFVRWKMGGTVEFIRRIGLRYRELRSEVELILERERTEGMRTMGRATIRIVESIADIDSKIKDATARASISQSRAVRLLRRAEIFLAVTITYYVGHVLQELIERNWAVGLWSFTSYIVVLGIVLVGMRASQWLERGEQQVSGD